MPDYLTGVDNKQAFKGSAVASGVTGTVILGPFDLQRYPKKAFTLYNVSAVTLSGALIQINPDQGGYEDGASTTNVTGATPPSPNAGLWENYDTTSFRSLASAGVKTVFSKDDVARWWRVIAIADEANVTVSGWLYATSV